MVEIFGIWSCCWSHLPITLGIPFCQWDFFSWFLICICGVNHGNAVIGHISAWLLPTVAHALLRRSRGIRQREDECIACMAQSQPHSLMMFFDVFWCFMLKSCSSNVYGMWGYHRTASGNEHVNVIVMDAMPPEVIILNSHHYSLSLVSALQSLRFFSHLNLK